MFACEPEWGALASELGGDKVNVFVATTAQQDPHQIQARPALIARLRSADLVVCTGAELEIGWMPVLLRQAANGRVQPGGPGYFEAAQQVRLLEVPTRLDRAEGDIHACRQPAYPDRPAQHRDGRGGAGTPHGELDPADAATFAVAWPELCRTVGGGDAALDAAGRTTARHHDRDATTRAGAISRTGSACARRRRSSPNRAFRRAANTSRNWSPNWPAKGVRGVIYSAYEDPRGAEFVAQRIGAPAIMLPFTVGGTDRAQRSVRPVRRHDRPAGRRARWRPGQAVMRRR